MRAMTFERLVRGTSFASEVATTTVGRLGLARPTEVHTVNAHVSADATANMLGAAHARAADGAVTLIHGLAIPFVGFEGDAATDVKPDFAVVAPTLGGDGQSWLVVGDAKDYERVRSRIEDTRLLKGFLQVALGAESAAAWTRLPVGMTVHDHGVLAAPRNAFLQPEALVESLEDHRAEVRMRVEERRAEAERTRFDDFPSVAAYVAHLEATFDPATCTTCTMFSYCRHRLQTSDEASDLLIELGVPTDVRPQVIGIFDGPGPSPAAPASVVAMIEASFDGVGRSTGQRRTDQAGQAGSVNVVVVKSDAAALGLHGIALQRVTVQGREPWETTVFDDPQAPQTRRDVMRLLGKALVAAMTDQRRANPAAPAPIHVVVPDAATADLLASIADNLAGVELSRLRWERDRAMGREALTFNGEPAQIPPRLRESDRTAISFLLEEDRARALTLRSPLVDLRDVLARHVVAGGPAVASWRLDYLVQWGEDDVVDFRDFAGTIEASVRTPGARLTNQRSDAIHHALTGPRGRRQGDPPHDPDAYAALVTDELRYKGLVLERALDVLAKVPDSALREVHRAIEGDAQAVWRRRLELHASDLVRFGRTYRFWRNALVPVIEGDARCRAQLLALANPQAALDLAAGAGVREVAFVTVVTTTPLTLDVESRRIRDGSRIVLLHRGTEACVEDPGVAITPQKSNFKFSSLAIGPLSATDHATPRRLVWAPQNVPTIDVGDRLVVADFAWFHPLKGNAHLAVARPAQDEVSAPKLGCTDDSYPDAPDAHRWCCRSHELAEAEFSDDLAARRARGELNPQAWPPIVDGDAFEVSGASRPEGDATTVPPVAPPESVTMDDLE